MEKLLKFIEYEYLNKLRDKFPGKRIVHCHGVFDLFHYGHLEHLRSAKNHGDILVVTITPDHFVNKGPNRPAFTHSKRAEIIASLDIVDFVAINTTETAVSAIKELRPDCYVKGPDYKNLDGDISGGIYEELAAVKAIGGVLILTDNQSESSTTLINTHLNQLDVEQKRVVEKIKEVNSLQSILQIIDSLKKLRVLVVGEPIIDHYVFCKPENLSSKSPTVSANFISEDYYPGGSWAVAAHLSALGCKTKLLAPRCGDSISESVERSLLAACPLIEILPCTHNGLVTPKKTRYISPFMNQRIFEMTHLDYDSWLTVDMMEFNLLLENQAKEVDVILALDFGHGLFEGDRLDALGRIKGFLSLNVQTNSGNYGFNLFHKHKRYDYLVLDERELRLGMHDRFSDKRSLAENAFREIKAEQICITLGSEGSVYLKKGTNPQSSPTYFDQPIDTTGAGDAFFAITSLLTYMKMEPLTIAFLGNLFAGLKTKIIGNKSPVSYISYIKTIKSLMG